jgi:hypothetical protein
MDWINFINWIAYWGSAIPAQLLTWIESMLASGNTGQLQAWFQAMLASGNTGPVQSFPGGPGGASPSATPELDSLVLFGTGLLAAGGYALTRFRARRRHNAPVEPSTR